MDRGYSVEWCDFETSTFYAGDFIEGNYITKDFATHLEAEKFAVSVLPKDCFGSVGIREFEMVPYERGQPGRWKRYLTERESIEA